MSTSVTLSVNGKSLTVTAGTSLAAALLNNGVTAFRTSATGSPRAPLCGMGICYECRVTIDGLAHQKACQVTVADGMEVSTDV